MKVSVEGAEPESAALVVILLHGGGSSALDFLGLSQEFPPDDGICWLAPQALSSRWYPGAPDESRGHKEPHLTVSVRSVLGLVERHSTQPVALVGFADGAGVVGELLTLPELPGSVAAAWMASGTLVGPETEWPEPPKLSVPILLSGSKDGAANERLQLTARYFERAGSALTRHLYDGDTAHIGAAEFALASSMLQQAKR